MSIVIMVTALLNYGKIHGEKEKFAIVYDLGSHVMTLSLFIWQITK